MDGGGGEKGVALVTVVLLLLIMTLIGIASITVTGIGSRMAGHGRTGEAGTGAAEACLGTAVKIIQQTIDAGNLPNTLLDNATPAGPVPAGNFSVLDAEIKGASDNNPDAADSSPNLTMQVDNFTVNGDIDRLYATPRAGGSLQMFGGYEGIAGGAAGGGVDIMYRIDCSAANAATGTRSRITAVYACMTTGESCQRKL
ncbi:MAG: PilX N-terminal domain-containing pilus assembly protein [Nitrospirota bacterium]